MTSTTGAPLRLHIGCGPGRLEGWVNIDRLPFASVDRVADVTRGIPFRDAAAIYAEHFLEHLALDDAVAFLREAHRALAPGGHLRLSTPNLDWVVASQYGPEHLAAGAGDAALHLNRGFHGWSHRFLWNRALLGEALAACGFESIAWCRWGESAVEGLRGIERHETYRDTELLPHVLIVEARKGAYDATRFAALRRRLETEFLDFVRPPRYRIDATRSRVWSQVRAPGRLGRLAGPQRVAATAIAGQVVWRPEALEESTVELELPPAPLAIEPPAARLPALLPLAFVRRLAARHQAVWRAVTAGATVVMAAAQMSAVDESRVRMRVTLRLGAALRTAETDAAIIVEGGLWQARGRLVLEAGAGGPLAVEYDLVAVAAAPT